MMGKSILSLLRTVARYAGSTIPLLFVYKTVIQPYLLSPLRRIPSPPVNPFTMMGHLPVFFKEDILDPMTYQKSEFTTGPVRRIIGYGLVTALGDDHKRQRAILNPAFRAKMITTMQPVFNECAMELCVKWNQEVNASSDGTHQLNASNEMLKVTLDIIGKAGFGHNFNAVNNQQSSLHESFINLMSILSINVSTVAETMFPFLQKIPSKRKQEIDASRSSIDQSAAKIVKEHTEAINTASLDDKGNNLMRLLIKANMEEVDPAKQITDVEMAAQVTTFLAAGHETTSNLLSWVLHHLARDQSAQNRLFAELQELIPEITTPVTPELLSSMTFLDSIVKETLRLAPSIPLLRRVAMEDGEIDGYSIPKGTNVMVPIYAVHRLSEYWGDDAEEWKPDRWDSKPVDSEESLDSVAGSQGSRAFGTYIPFNVGPRNCIGHRFATLESKTVLAVLCRSFSFTPVDSSVKVIPKVTITLKAFPDVLLNLKRRACQDI
ncbi:hypothetical protein HDU76_007924 [Blyttiomyces sp. JEL0837]|nr:hypothetical protein HDU76_007924 [Blyttiomyces sp. JEL0837]